MFTSCEVASRWQSANLDGFQKWMTNQPGGGYPEKLDQMLASFCASKKIPVPQHVQHTGGDEDFLDLAIRTGRMPGVTYAGMDDFYGPRQKIAHMVNLAHLDATSAAIIDNNRPGNWVWMSRKDFLSRWRDMQGGWAVVFLDPPPPVYTSPPIAMFGQILPWRRPQVQPQCPGGVCPVAPPIYTPAPIEVPEVAAAPIEKNYGIDPGKVHNGRRWFLNGEIVEREDALLALADDSTRWNLTAVGDAPSLAKFRAAVAALDPAIRSKVHVQAYAASHWAVAQFKLPIGVSIRKPGAGRTGSDAGQLAGDVSPEVLTRFVADAFDPPPAPMPKPDPPAPAPAPLPEPQPVPAPSPAPTSNGFPSWGIALIAAIAAALALRRKT